MWMGKRVAIKEFTNIDNAHDTQLLIHELDMLCTVTSPRIITAYGACTDQYPPYILTEWMDGGTIYHFFHNLPAGRRALTVDQAPTLLHEPSANSSHVQDSQNPPTIYDDDRP